MRVTECSAIQADAKEVGYVLVGAKRPGRRGPILKMRSHCFRQYGLVFALVLMCLLPNSMRAFTLVGPRYSTGAIVQSISPRTYIMSDQLIKLPPDVFGSTTEASVSSIFGLEPSALVGSVTIVRKTFLGANDFTPEIDPPSQYIFIQN